METNNRAKYSPRRCEGVPWFHHWASRWNICQGNVWL